MSRAGCYAWKKRPPSNRDEGDVELTIQIHEEHEGDWVSTDTGELAKLGHGHSPKRVRRLVQAAGLTCVHPKPYKSTTIRDEAAGNDGLVDLADHEFVPD